MTTRSAAAAAAAAPLSTVRAFATPRDSPTTVVVAAVAAGAIMQALFWRTSIGVNWLVCDLLQTAAAVALFRRGPLRAPAWGAIGGSVALGAAVACHASAWSLAVALPVNVALLSTLPTLLRGDRTIGELAALPADLAASLLRVPRATRRTGQVAAQSVDFGRGRGLVLGVGLGLPTAGLFALLLCADPSFTALVSRAFSKVSDVVSFTAWALFTAGALLFWHALHTPEKDDELAPAPPAPFPYRIEPSAPVTTLAAARPVLLSRSRLSLQPLTWGAIVAQVAIVFAAFDAVNARRLFGGHHLVRATQGVTYASYLHSGFGQLLFAAALSVCLVVGGHRLLANGAGASEVKDHGEHRARVPGGAVIVALEVVLLVLTGVTLASCWQRLAIYEDAYGATYLRLGVAFIEALVLGVLVLTIAKAVARGWRGYAGTLVAFATSVGAVAGCFDADAYVAGANLDRASRGHELDVAYLATLSGDACTTLSHPVLAAQPEVARTLRDAWAADLAVSRGNGWRAARGVFDQCQLPSTAPQPK